MKAINIARVSTEEQKEANNSLPAQEERIKNYCSKRSFDVIKTYSFEESAYKTKRDEFDTIVEHIQEEAKKEKIAVCFDKVDRFSRGSVFDKRVGLLYEMALENEIELHFVSDGQVINNKMSAVEKFHFGMSLGLAKYYSDAIGDNVRRAFEQKRKVGEWTGAVRIGYLNITLDKEKRLRKDIIIDPERGHLIRKMFELYATGSYSLETIRLEMTKQGLRSLKGFELSKSSVENILKDSFYCGVAISKKYGAYDHKYPRLITRELFDKCQVIREGRHMNIRKFVSKDFIFKGLLKCKNCGCAMSPEIKIKKSGKTFTYYSCTNGKKICKRLYVPEKALLEPVHVVFEAFSAIPQEVQERLVTELRNMNEHEAVYHENQIARIRAEYDRAQKKIQTLLDLLLDKSITQEDYDKKLKELKSGQYSLNKELETYTKADHRYHTHVGTVLDLSRRMGEIFEGSEPSEKREILRYLLQNPTVNEKTLGFTLRSPFNLVAELATSPNWLRG